MVKTLWCLASPAGQHGEIIRQQGVISAGGTGALLLQPRLYTLLVEAVSALQHADVIWTHVFVTNDARILHVQCIGMCGSLGSKLLPDRGGGYQRGRSTISWTPTPHGAGFGRTELLLMVQDQLGHSTDHILQRHAAKTSTAG